MSYEKRQLTKIVEEICNEKNFELKKYSDDWIMQINNNNGKNCFIFGYKFPNNNAAISRICDDKAALASVLRDGNIPCVSHEYFEYPNSPMNGDGGIYTNLFDMLEKYGELVCKTNSGSGGSSVYLVKTKKELETAAFKILGSTRAMAVSPKVDIQNEYRIIVENKRALLIYSKERPSVIGDGHSTVAELMTGMNVNKDDLIGSLNYNIVPSFGEKVTVAWKHNLGQGSLPVLVSDEQDIHRLAKFALDTAKFLNLDFASIDIVRDKQDNYKILEINSGIMMENFSKLSKDNYEIAKHIYKSAIQDYFGENVVNQQKNIYEEISDKINAEREL